MASKFGQTVVQNPTGQGKPATVIFLHGLGDSGQGISAVGQALRSSTVPDISHVKMVFPSAPVTMFNGMRMPAWFDLDPRILGSVDNKGINSSISYLEELVAEEVKNGVPPERIVIGGFSQGGHIALKYLFQASVAPAACIALSTWLEPSFNKQFATESCKAVRTFLGHGTADALLPLPLAQSTAALLREKGLRQVDFKTYNGMQHSTCAEELSDIRNFLSQILPKADSPTRDEVDSMSVKELKNFLHSRSIDTRSILEKSELIERAKAAL
ncbi:g8794 [Coccomyxa elongata]